MAEQLQIPFPMWRVQYQLLGGHKRIAGTLVISLTVLLIAVAAMRKFMPAQPLTVTVDWVLTFLGPIQAVILVLGGCNAVHRAMLRDHESRMNESHRLTPMSNLAVVLGYIFGATLQILPLWGLMLATGAVLARIGSPLTLAPWFKGNLLVLNGAVTLWSATVFFGMRPEKPFNPNAVLVGGASLTIPLAMLPGAGMLLNLYPIMLGIWVMNGRMPIPREAIITVGLINVGFTLFWILAGAAKYRRPDLPALNGVRGMVLLIVTMVISTVGIVVFQRATGKFQPGTVDAAAAGPSQWIATMIGGLLLAAVPVAGAVRCRTLGTRGTALRGWSDRVSPVGVALLASSLVVGIMASLGWLVWRDVLRVDLLDDERRSAVVGIAWLMSAAACLVGSLTLMYVLQIGYAVMRSPKTILLLFLVVAWAVPPFVDLIRATVTQEYTDTSLAFSWLLGCSPPGTIIAAWQSQDIRFFPGWIVQAVVCLVLAVVARRVTPQSPKRESSPLPIRKN